MAVPRRSLSAEMFGRTDWRPGHSYNYNKELINTSRQRGPPGTSHQTFTVLEPGDKSWTGSSVTPPVGLTRPEELRRGGE